MVQLSHPYMSTGKIIALTRRTFVGKVMSLLLNMLSRLVITFLPRRKRLLISWLQSPSAVILKVLVAQSCLTLCNPLAVALQAPLSMGFPRQEYWSGLPFPPPGDLPTQGSNPGHLHCRWILYQLSYQGSPGILLYIRFPQFIHLIIESLYPLTNISPFSSPSQPPAAAIPLFLCIQLLLNSTFKWYLTVNVFLWLFHLA